VNLANKTFTVAHSDGYAATVRDWSKRRGVLSAMQALTAKIHENGRYDSELRATLEILQLATMREGPVDFRTAEQIADYYGAVSWCWPGWVPSGYLSMIVGPQGAGKSYLGARLVGSLTGSIPTWPDGARCDLPPGRVLIVETEELRGLYVERLDGMGVDRGAYFFGPGDETHIVNLWREMPVIERLAQQEGATAILVDSLSGAHDRDEDKSGIRQVLQRLAAMASRLRGPVILVHHARKRGQLEPVAVTLDRVRGSTTITQFCRAVLAVYRLKEGDQTGPVRLEMIKSTFGKPPPAAGFTIADAGLTFGEAPEEQERETQRDRGGDLLRALLEDGPMLQKEIEAEAKGAGISWSTMTRSKETLKIVSVRRKYTLGSDTRMGWFWSLPADK